MLKTAYIFFLSLMVLSHSIAQIPGCTDPLAINYSIIANQNDGSCLYPPTSIKPIISWPLPGELNETSGLILWNHSIWTHNDDTDIRLYKMSLNDFSAFDAFELTGASNTDWEEIAQDELFIYIGDFGNNGTGLRTDLNILRIEKASLSNQQPAIDTILFSYESQTFKKNKKSNQTDFDCEAFIVSKDSIYLFTKEWLSEKTSVYSPAKTPGNHIARFLDSYDVNGLITGATSLENKNLTILTGYSALLQPFLLLLYDYDGSDFFGGHKRKVTLDLPFHQVEGIASEDGLNVYLSNERFAQSFFTIDQKVHYIDASEYLGDYLANLTRLENPADISALKVYPNPFTDKFQIEVDPNTHVRFEMINSIGSLVLKGQFYGNTKIDTDHLQPGLYVLKLNSGQNLVFRKILKSF